MSEANLAQPIQPIPSNVSTVDGAYPAGHLGHLTEHQDAQLVAFKKLLQERGLYTPGPPASHDDPTLLRYLRARRWHPADALTQFADTEAWRAANDIDLLYKTIELPAYDASRRLYPQWTGRCDRRGIPLYVFEIRTLDAKAVADYEKQGKDGKAISQAKSDGRTPQGLVRLFALYENLTRFNMPFCTQLQDREFPGTPITMSTNIVDIQGVSLRQFWNLKNHMQAASQLATAHYPETLDRIFVIGAPSFFITVWGWVKRWFDPITVSKIFILSEAEVKPTLEAYIDPANIPTKYGGRLAYQFGDMPVNDPVWDGNLRWENGHTGFGSGPMIWRDTADGTRVECVGLGASSGALRDEVICSVAKTWPTADEEEEASAPRENGAPIVDDVAAGVEGLSVTDEKRHQPEMAPPLAPSTAAA
ncbi:hypothetical protein BN1708_008841 [Verticillium longisporum]|uniref:CRAL-TRIO domain-containing protein n=2 Tax=Verticillium longisporum TaxID=100787 RepID=A0A0G4N8I8_VERLO|nr:hypothetical protein BN1708_008841 [Verticillium longisporum]